MSRDIVLTVDADAGKQEVYEAVTTRAGLAGFWTPDVTATAEVGASLRFGFEPAPVDLEMTVEDLQPGAHVVWSCPGPWPYWTGTEVEWRFEDGPEGGTRVVLLHTGWDDDYDDGEFGAVAYTWALVLRALKGYVETGTPQPALG